MVRADHIKGCILSVAELEGNARGGRKCTKKKLWTLKIYKLLIFTDFSNILNKIEIQKN
jgi:hypothetical protein